MSDSSGGAKSASSMVEIFNANVAERAETVAARYKKGGKWKDVTWGKYGTEVEKIAGGLLSLGVEPGERVSLIANTRWEYIASQYGILSAGCVLQPVYQTLLPHEIDYIVNNAGSVAIIAEDAVQLDKILEIKDKLPDVKHVILMDGESDDDWVMSMAELQKAGAAYVKENPDAIKERSGDLKPDDNLLIMYTSGTTGPPKGVVLTHDAMIYEGQGVQDLNLLDQDTVQLIFLPLAHSFAQVLATAWVQTCHTLAFAEGLDKIVQNLAEVRPTFMGAVPRIYEKVYSKVVSGGLSAGGIKGFLFKKFADHSPLAGDAEKAGQPYGGFWWWLVNKAVVPKVSERLDGLFGGRLTFFLSGGAPLAPKIAFFFKHVGVTILEGYGLTETSAGTCVTLPHDNRIGTVGPPLPGSKVKIAKDGEILLAGRGVMKEYWRLPDATAEVFSEEKVDGKTIKWFHTGDIGELDDDGYLRITDRKKDIIVTAGGKNIAPQNIENLFKTSRYISQMVVHGDKRKFCSALITLDPENIVAWGVEQGMLDEGEVKKAATDAVEKSGTSTADLDWPTLLGKAAPLGTLGEFVKKIHGESSVRDLIQVEVEAFNGTLAKYETIKKFEILDIDFEVGDILTPTLKVKRKVVTERYKKMLDNFYGD
ncbi:MAG: long-chain fatty acid--CoA ligase [Deltaproteobacteria bacterium]|nr:long-chain fatty acid--CoA ligase [Deltaproteobacteria bacterium]